MPLSNTTPVASLDNVTKHFGVHKALDHLSFSLYPGELVALLGANGAGKTTAIRHLLGLTQPTSGRVTLFGQSPSDRGARRHIGAMLQTGDGGLEENLKVREHIDLFSSYYPQPLALEDTIKLANVGDLANIQYKHLSGGQRQRVMFALALCGNPDLLFLDEPTVGLDIDSRHALWTQIRTLIKAGKTVLLTTHYIEEAEQLADRILVMQNGRIVAQGTSAEIKAAYNQREIRCHTSLSDAALLATKGVLSLRREGITVVLSSNNPDLTTRHLFLQDEELTNINVSQIGLQEAFLALTADLARNHMTASHK